MSKIAPKIILVNRIHTTANNHFSHQEVERLALSILDGGGLINPLIVTRRGYENYDLIDGELQYFAAKLAVEKDPVRGESIDAYIIEGDNAEAMQQQINILRQPNSATAEITISMRQLENMIELKTQPLLNKINCLEHELLDALKRIEEKLKSKSTAQSQSKKEKAKIAVATEPGPLPAWIDHLNCISAEDFAALVTKHKKGRNINSAKQQTLLKDRPFQQAADLNKISPTIIQHLQEIFQDARFEHHSPPQAQSTDAVPEDVSSALPTQSITTASDATESDPILERINTENAKELAFKLTRANIAKPVIEAILEQRPFASRQEIRKIKRLSDSNFQKIIDLMAY